jgi:tripeptidyl-peptidase-1
MQPASSPWVTAVGATQLMAETVETRESPTEIACSIATGALITSGGGFSSEFERPQWQDWAVQNYLDTAVLPREALFNGSRRGYPDLSLFGHSFVVVDNGTPIAVDGTSASAPTLAGILTL